MKALLISSILFFSSMFVSAQALTGDQIASIRQNASFQDRIKATLLLKAEYWKESASSTRASVNVQFQKRKRLAKQILGSNNWVDQNAAIVGQYWLAYYQTASPTLDGSGVPTYLAIFNNFDATFDNFAGYKTGDENVTEIDW